MTASITPDELVVAGGRWTTRSPAVVRWDRGRLSVDQFRAEGPPGTITASAVMEAGGSDARIAVGLEQARLPPPLDRVTPGEVRGGGAAHQDRAGGRVDPRPLAGGNAVPGRPRAVRRADRAPQPAHGRRGRVGACPRPGSRCRPGDRLRRRERIVAGAGRQRADRGDRPHERGGHAHRGHGAVPAHALGHPDCRRPRRPREGSTRARGRSVLGDRRVARAGNADGPGPDGGRLADRGAPRRLPGGRRAARGDRRVHPRSRRGRAGDGVVAVERGRSPGGPARTGRVGGAPRCPPGPRPCRLGVGAPRGRVPVSRGRHRLAGAPVRRGPRRGGGARRRDPGGASSEGVRSAPSSAFPSVGSAPSPRGAPRRAPR